MLFLVLTNRSDISRSMSRFGIFRIGRLDSIVMSPTKALPVSSEHPVIGMGTTYRSGNTWGKIKIILLEIQSNLSANPSLGKIVIPVLPQASMIVRRCYILSGIYSQTEIKL